MTKESNSAGILILVCYLYIILKGALGSNSNSNSFDDSENDWIVNYNENDDCIVSVLL